MILCFPDAVLFVSVVRLCGLLRFASEISLPIFKDVTALIVQAVGGASASEDLQSGKGDPNK